MFIEVFPVEPILLNLTLHTVEAQLAVRQLESAVLTEKFESGNIANDQIPDIARRMEFVMTEGHTLQLRLEQLRTASQMLAN